MGVDTRDDRSVEVTDQGADGLLHVFVRGTEKGLHLIIVVLLFSFPFPRGYD